jgi:hypothetical protein
MVQGECEMDMKELRVFAELARHLHEIAEVLALHVELQKTEDADEEEQPTRVGWTQ